MLKGLCAVAAALTTSCLASADAGDTLPDHQYFPGTDPWTTPDFHLPKKREWPDGPNKEFLKNLQRPDNYKNPWRDKHSQLCCDAGDTVKTKFKVEPGEGLHPEDRWYALINGQWKPVPPDKIVPSYAPDGQAFLFMAADVILCFVRPKGGL
jgi:hypothetical protein